MLAEAVFFTVWVAACLGIGAWHLIAAERITAARRARATRAAAKYANRPALLRPAYANSRPTLAGTRLTGAGFCVLGLAGMVIALRLSS